MKKRDLLAATIVYVLSAFMIVVIAAMIAGDCPTALTDDVYRSCSTRADGMLFYGFVASLGLYPFFLALCIRRSRRRHD